MMKNAAKKSRSLEAIKSDLIEARAAVRKARLTGRGTKRLNQAMLVVQAEYRAHPEHPWNQALTTVELVRKAALRWADENLGGTGNGQALQDCEQDGVDTSEEVAEWSSHARTVLARVQAANDPLTLNSMEKRFSSPAKKASKRRK